MKAMKVTFVTALAGGSLLALSSTLYSQDSTNTPPAGAASAGGGMMGNGSMMGGGMMGHGPMMTGGPGMMREGPDLDQMAKDLNLTDEQKTKVKDTFEARRQKMRELFQNRDLSMQDRRTKMMEIMNETNAKIKSILTPDQFQKWQTMQQRVRRPNAPRGPGVPPTAGDNNTNAPPGVPPPRN